MGRLIISSHIMEYTVISVILFLPSLLTLKRVDIEATGSAHTAVAVTVVVEEAAITTMLVTGQGIIMDQMDTKTAIAHPPKSPPHMGILIITVSKQVRNHLSTQPSHRIIHMVGITEVCRGLEDMQDNSNIHQTRKFSLSTIMTTLAKT